MGRVRVRTRLPPQRPRPVFKPSSRRRAKQRTKTASLARVERKLRAIIASLDFELIHRLIARARRARRRRFTLAVRRPLSSGGGGGGVDEAAVTRALNSLSAADAAVDVVVDVAMHPYTSAFDALFDEAACSESSSSDDDDAADDDDDDDDDDDSEHVGMCAALLAALNGYMESAFGVHVVVVDNEIVVDDLMARN